MLLIEVSQRAVHLHGYLKKQGMSKVACSTIASLFVCLAMYMKIFYFFKTEYNMYVFV
jgi:hypothetical protein